MRVLVVYESMFGNTHVVADRIGAGLAGLHDVEVLPVAEADHDRVASADAVVVGGPTHAHGLSREASRTSAWDQAAKDDALDLDPAATGPGLREWLDGIVFRQGLAAAFDTRGKGPALLLGQASKGIAKRLVRHGFDLVAEPESFLVDRHNALLPGEAERAEAWGEELATKLAGVGVA